MREVLAHLLKRIGVRATLVADGREAVEAVHRKPFSLVLMDCQMPVLDGYAAAREIRRSERATGGHVPILAMTGGTTEEDRAACLAAGMDDYLAKPIRHLELRAALERWLDRPEAG